MSRDVTKYVRDGVRWPSASDIVTASGLSSGLSQFDPDWVAARAHFGSCVHQGVELHLEDRLDWDDLDPQLLPYLEQFLAFERATGFRPMSIEIDIENAALRYCGQLDAVGTAPLMGVEAPAIWDWKTARSWVDSWAIQMALYAMADRFDTPPRRFGVRINEDRWWVKEYTADEDFFVAKNAVSETWRQIESGELVLPSENTED